MRNPSRNAGTNLRVRSILATAAAALAANASLARAQAIGRVSIPSHRGIDSTGTSSNGASVNPAISADGRFVAFASVATDLVAGDTNGASDVFVHDRTTGATVRMSVDSTGNEGNGDSVSPSISADGRFVAFTSWADNLVDHDTNGACDVFVHDRDPDGNGLFDEGNGVTIRVSIDSNGLEANGDSFSEREALSGDGKRVVFASDATNLVAADTNLVRDAFLRDLTSGATSRVSVDSSGLESNGPSYTPTISRDARWVAFESDASNLVAGDGNGKSDIFLRDVARGVTSRASIDSDGSDLNGGAGWAQGPASLSGDGQLVAFGIVIVDDMGKTGLWIYVRDQANASTETVVDGYLGGTSGPSISNDGARVVFDGVSPPSWWGFWGWSAQLFEYDRLTQITTLDPYGSTLAFMNPVASTDGSIVAFASTDALTADDSNHVSDVFVSDRLAATAATYGWASSGSSIAPTLTASAPPVIGTSIVVGISNSSGADSFGILLLGLEAASLPLWDGDDDGISEWTVWVDAVRIVPVLIPAAGLSMPADIPDEPELIGDSIRIQVIQSDLAAAHQLSFTAGLNLVIGDRTIGK